MSLTRHSKTERLPNQCFHLLLRCPVQRGSLRQSEGWLLKSLNDFSGQRSKGRRASLGSTPPPQECKTLLYMLKVLMYILNASISSKK